MDVYRFSPDNTDAVTETFFYLQVNIYSGNLLLPKQDKEHTACTVCYGELPASVWGDLHLIVFFLVNVLWCRKQWNAWFLSICADVALSCDPKRFFFSLSTCRTDLSDKSFQKCSRFEPFRKVFFFPDSAAEMNRTIKVLNCINKKFMELL